MHTLHCNNSHRKKVLFTLIHVFPMCIIRFLNFKSPKPGHNLSAVYHMLTSRIVLKYKVEVKEGNSGCQPHLLLLTIAMLHRCIVGLRAWSGIYKAGESQMQPSQWKASTTTSEQVREQDPLWAELSTVFSLWRFNLESLPAGARWRLALVAARTRPWLGAESDYWLFSPGGNNHKGGKPKQCSRQNQM